MYFIVASIAEESEIVFDHIEMISIDMMNNLSGDPSA
jgi:hypothetical protein